MDINLETPMFIPMHDVENEVGLGDFLSGLSPCHSPELLPLDGQ